MQTLLSFIFRLMGHLPLWLLHAFGNVLGFLAWYFSPTLRRRIRLHIGYAGWLQDGGDINRAGRQVASESVKSGLELAVAWTRSPEYIASLFKNVHGWDAVESAIQDKKGLLFITPHLGSYDLAGRMLSECLPFPLTAMYRPPKQAWLEPIMNQGRVRGKGHTAPATAQGVRQVLKALKQKEAVIILPDQVPQSGEGVVVRFFGQAAYTMTLATRLMEMKDVATFFFVGERLPRGQGFDLNVVPLEGDITHDRTQDTQLINDNVSSLILTCPTQYLFSYNRYKMPAGVNDAYDNVI